MNNYRLSFLIILIIVNVLLLFSQYKKNQYIENLHYQILEQTVESSQFSVSKKILTNFKYPLNLVVLFPDNYCKAWQDIDMPYLRSLSYKYANAILVIDTNLPYSIDFLTDLGIPIYEVNTLSEAIEGSFIQIRVPTILLVDANGVIQDVYTNDYRKPQKTEYYYSQINSLFESIYGDSINY